MNFGNKDKYVRKGLSPSFSLWLNIFRILFNQNEDKGKLIKISYVSTESCCRYAIKSYI